MYWHEYRRLTKRSELRYSFGREEAVLCESRDPRDESYLGYCRKSDRKGASFYNMNKDDRQDFEAEISVERSIPTLLMSACSY